jgi:hypothetical protein
MKKTQYIYRPSNEHDEVVMLEAMRLLRIGWKTFSYDAAFLWTDPQGKTRYDEVIIVYDEVANGIIEANFKDGLELIGTKP